MPLKKPAGIPHQPGVYPVRGRGNESVKLDLKINLKLFPTSNGVYFFKNARGRILYVGKAVNLRQRLAVYFRPEISDRRIRQMVSAAAQVDWKATGSEIEALIWESQWIKKERPRFNVMLRDDKQYFYVGLTKEKFPRLFLTHQPFDSAERKRRVASLRASLTEFIGPFTSGQAIKTALKLLRRIFPYCSCKQKHHRYCLNYHIGKCLGFCCLNEAGIRNYELGIRNSEIQQYQKNIQAIKAVLTGKKLSLVQAFRKEMRQRAAAGELEKAIILRDKVEKLERVFENAKILQAISGRENVFRQLRQILGFAKPIERVEGYDISNIQGQFATGAMVVFTRGRPAKSEYRKFRIRRTDAPDDTARLREVLERRFNHPEWRFPDLLVIDGGKAQYNTAAAVVHRRAGDIPVIALTKNRRHVGERIFVPGRSAPLPLKNLPKDIRNLILHIDAEAHRFSISYYRKLHRRDFRRS